MRRRYVYMDGEMVEVSPDYVQVRDARTSHNIIPDINSYKSMIDGTVITSRSKHRAHLKAHGCIEVGNETKHLLKPKTYEPAPGLKETIIREVHRAKDAQRAGRKYGPQ